MGVGWYSRTSISTPAYGRCRAIKSSQSSLYALCLPVMRLSCAKATRRNLSFLYRGWRCFMFVCCGSETVQTPPRLADVGAAGIIPYSNILSKILLCSLDECPSRFDAIYGHQNKKASWPPGIATEPDASPCQSLALRFFLLQKQINGHSHVTVQFPHHFKV